MWHGYFVIERGSVGVGNWSALLALFDAMGTHDSPFPMYNNHSRLRLDGDAKIYESNFHPGEVSVADFKQVLADELGVPVEDITHTQSVISYGDYATTVWEFLYNAVVRFTIRRFGRGGSWEESRNECRGYLIANFVEWG